jgi:hypothetical protein
MFAPPMMLLRLLYLTAILTAQIPAAGARSSGLILNSDNKTVKIHIISKIIGFCIDFA